MEQAFFKDRLSKCGIRTLIPESAERDYVHSAIFTELTRGVFTEETKGRFRVLIRALQERGAEGVIFGCTEIPLLLKQSDVAIPVFDTSTIHATAAADFALSE